MPGQDPETPWTESDDEFEGVGAHPDNPRYDHDTAVSEYQAAQSGQYDPSKPDAESQKIIADAIAAAEAKRDDAG